MGIRLNKKRGRKKNKSLEKTNESTKRFSWISNFKYCILAFVSWGDQPQLKPSRHPSDARTDWYISHGTNVLAPDPHARSKPCPIRDSNRFVVPTGKFKLTRVEGVDQHGDKKKTKRRKEELWKLELDVGEVSLEEAARFLLRCPCAFCWNGVWWIHSIVCGDLYLLQLL